MKLIRDLWTKSALQELDSYEYRDKLLMDRLTRLQQHIYLLEQEENPSLAIVKKFSLQDAMDSFLISLSQYKI